MSSARHTCNCYDCVGSRGRKQELQHGGTDWEVDDSIPLRYRSKKKRKRGVCAKSKTGEPCDRLGKKVKGTVREYDREVGEWVNNKPRNIVCCSRCGREHWWIW